MVSEGDALGAPGRKGGGPEALVRLSHAGGRNRPLHWSWDLGEKTRTGRSRFGHLGGQGPRTEAGPSHVERSGETHFSVTSTGVTEKNRQAGGVE